MFLICLILIIILFVLVGYLPLRVKRLEFGNNVQDKLNDTITNYIIQNK